MINFSPLLSDLQAAIAVVAARERSLTVMLVAVWGRIAQMRTRLERLIGLWRAGMLPVPRTARAGAARALVRAASVNPIAPAWLLVAVREAASTRAQLEHLLSETECVEFLAAFPQAVRILRPLCRMLGIGVKPAKGPRPRPVWQAPRPAAVMEAVTGLVMGPRGRLIYV
ncbi:MAG: hypothetical protein H7251_07990 [Acetobacteraceae bacterium]|nr:hypothetical protein [Acetobacteraceae bacterium]